MNFMGGGGGGLLILLIKKKSALLVCYLSDGCKACLESWEVVAAETIT